jgi:hypothetical protein
LRGVLVAIVGSTFCAVSGCSGDALPSSEPRVAASAPTSGDETSGTELRGAAAEIGDLYAAMREITRGGAGGASAYERLAQVRYADEEVSLVHGTCLGALQQAGGDGGTIGLSYGLGAGHAAMVGDSCITLLMTVARRYNVVPSESRQHVDLVVDGELVDGDAVVEEDQSLYDDYSVELERGWTLEVGMESDDFDTYLWLVGLDGRSVLQTDDTGTAAHGDTDSYFRVRIQQSGTYIVRANAYDGSGRGRYRLRVKAGLMPLIP